MDLTALMNTFKVKKDSALAALQQRLAGQNGSLDTEQNTATSNFQKLLPKFQQNRDNAAVNTDLAVGQMNNRLATQGAYGGGTAVSNFAQLMGQKNMAIAQQDANQSGAESDLATQLNDIANRRQQYQNAYNSDVNTTSQQIDAESALAQQQAIEAEAQAQAAAQAKAAAASRSSGSGSSASYSKDEAIGALVNDAKTLFDQGMDMNQVQQQILSKLPQLARYQITLNDLNKKGGIWDTIGSVYSVGGYAQSTGKAKQLAAADNRGL